MLPSMTPRLRSTQSIGLKTESSIHSQATADRATGVVQGSRTRNRTSHLPRKSATRMLARTLPRTTIRAIETTVKTKVLRSERQNTGSSRARWKVRRPAHWKLGSPAVTSLKANPMARKNGTATSATTYRIDGTRNQIAIWRSLSAKCRAGLLPARTPGRSVVAASMASASDRDGVGPVPALGVEEPQPVGVHGELVRLPDGDRGRDRGRQPGDDPGLLADAGGRAVHVPVAGQVLDPVHLERHQRPLGPSDVLGRQQVLGAEPDEAAVAGDQVHRRGADEGGHEGVGRVVVDLDRLAELAHPAVVHDRDPVAQAHGLGLVVGHVDGGRPDPLLEALELVAGAGAQLGVQVRQRLVEQEDVRLADQRPGQGDPLALPAGELARLAGEQVVDAEQLDRPACLALLLGLAEPLGPEREDDVLHDALVRVQG